MMSSRRRRLMMISTHGYVSAHPEFGKPDTGGQVVYVLELSRHLARLGYQVDILTRRFERQPETEKVDDQVRILRFRCGGPKFIGKETLFRHLPEWVVNAQAYIQKKRLTYEFINSHYWDAGVAGYALSQQLSIPHIHTPHSLGAWKRDNMDGDPAELESRYNFDERVREERILMQEADGVVATTPQQRDILRGADYGLPLEAIAVIPPGYDDSRFFPVSSASRDAIKRDFGYEGRFVLALGRLARNKGYDLLIRAMAPVCERFDDAKLMLAIGSTNPSEDEVEQLAQLKALAEELGISDRVVFQDYIPDDALADHYRMANVFALSSRYEPFGMTAVEAMACGTPTVITTQGGLWEQVVWGVEAIYADPFDPAAYGQAICNVLQFPEVAGRMSKLGSHKARERFTWTGIAQQVLQLFERRRNDDGVRTAKKAKSVEMALQAAAAGAGAETYF